jgi:fructan beta-fructosidase
MLKEKAGVIDVESQSIAYSLDDGNTWIKYKANPVLKNPGVRDFRDPKVFWHEQSKNWVASIAAHDQISFYASSDLKNWKKLSDFGKTVGSHDGVWECPDLFPIEYEGKTVWVLIVNINPGGPNGGSASQYFVGDFNGKEFKCDYKQTKWIDYGPDEYAGVTWSNTGKRKIFIGWMSNWQYANIVPTEKFRNAFTIPRELGLKKINDEYYVTSAPIAELKKIEKKSYNFNNITIDHSTNLTSKIAMLDVPSKFNFILSNKNNFSIELLNNLNEKVVIGYNKEKNMYFLDRRNSGNISFYKNFGSINYAPRLSSSNEISLSIYLDLASIEVFADNGLSVLTSVLFPNEKFSTINITSTEKWVLKNFTYTALHSIW